MRFLISVSDTFYDKLKLEADKAGMNVSEYVRYCVNRHWDYMYCARKEDE